MEYSQIVVNKGYDGLNPVILGAESCKKGHAYGPAIRSYYLIHYVISGRGIFVSKGETHKVGAGEMFVIAPGEETFYKADDVTPWEYIWIGFTSDSPLPLELAPKITCPEAQTIFKDMLSCEKMEKGRSAYLSARLWDLFSVLLEKSTEIGICIGIPFCIYLIQIFYTMIKCDSKNRKSFCGADRPVHVNAYIRVRFGRTENVCEHCRSKWGSNNA
jgi:hypothetical protein